MVPTLRSLNDKKIEMSKPTALTTSMDIWIVSVEYQFTNVAPTQ
jgi:hypothetical protein